VDMSQSELLKLAKSGDPQAISAVINKSLQPKGISAKTTLSNGCLTIALESEKDVPEAQIVEFVKNGISRLAPESVTRVIVRSRLIGKSTDTWRNAFTLEMGKGGENAPTSASDPIADRKVTLPQPVNGRGVMKVYEALPDIIKTRNGERAAIAAGTFLLTSAFWGGAGLIGSLSKASLPFSRSQTISGGMTLIDSDTVGTGEHCAGSGGYSDIKDAMPVTIKDGAGAIIAKGVTGDGTRPKDGGEYSSIKCRFEFKVENVPKSDFYQVEIGRRGGLTFSFDEMQKKEWKVESSL
jgi:hypothetical protein